MKINHTTLDGLITAAVAVDECAKIQEDRTKAWQELAIAAKEGTSSREEIQTRRDQLSNVVVDFSGPVHDLRKALRRMGL